MASCRSVNTFNENWKKVNSIYISLFIYLKRDITTLPVFGNQSFALVIVRNNMLQNDIGGQLQN